MSKKMSIKRKTYFFIQLLLSCQVMSNCLQPHGLQHARLPCPSPIPGVCSTSCPLSRWCHPTILSSVAPSTPVLNIYQSQDFFKWVSSSPQVAKSIGASAIASVFPIYIQNWFHLGLTGLISLLLNTLFSVQEYTLTVTLKNWLSLKIYKIDWFHTELKF